MSVTEVFRLNSVLSEAGSPYLRKSQEVERVVEFRKAVEEQNYRLEATIDLLVEDYWNATEKLVDADEERESLASFEYFSLFEIIYFLHLISLTRAPWKYTNMKFWLHKWSN